MANSFIVGWRQVAACFLLLAAIAFVSAGYSVVAVPLGQEFGPSRMVLMLAMTVMSAVAAVLAPVLGSLMDRMPLGRLMMLGSLLLAAGYFALSFTTSFMHVLVIFGLLVAPGTVLIGPMAATVLLSRWFAKRRGTAIGIALAGISMGAVFYPPVVQWLLDTHEWREAFRLLALLLLALTFPAAALVIDRPADKGLHPDGDPAPPQAAGAGAARAAAAAAAAPISARAILTDPAFWLVVAMLSVVSAGAKGMVTNLAPIALDQGIKASDAALLISLYGVCGFMSKLLFAGLADRIGPRRMLFATLGGFAAGMACLSQAATGFAMIVAGLALLGVFGGFMIALKSLLVPRIFGERVVGKAMGLLSMVSLVALLASPPLFGLVFDLTGSYVAIFAAFAVLASLAMLLAPALRMDPKEHEAAAIVPAAG
jgi:MFS family permease